MTDPKLLIGILSLVFSAVIGLIVYLWKQKDKQSEKVSVKLDLILEEIKQNSKETAEIKKDVHTIYTETNRLRDKTDKTDDGVSKNTSHIATLMEFKKNQESKN